MLQRQCQRLSENEVICPKLGSHECGTRIQRIGYLILEPTLNCYPTSLQIQILLWFQSTIPLLLEVSTMCSTEHKIIQKYGRKYAIRKYVLWKIVQP